jgi:hypothetical protein
MEKCWREALCWNALCERQRKQVESCFLSFCLLPELLRRFPPQRHLLPLKRNWHRESGIGAPVAIFFASGVEHYRPLLATMSLLPSSSSRQSCARRWLLPSSPLSGGRAQHRCFRYPPCSSTSRSATRASGASGAPCATRSPISNLHSPRSCSQTGSPRLDAYFEEDLMHLMKLCPYVDRRFCVVLRNVDSYVCILLLTENWEIL